MDILLVDDDQDHSALLSEDLRGLDHVVRIASDGRDALEIVDHEVYDTIVLDRIMPRLDGNRGTFMNAGTHLQVG